METKASSRVNSPSNFLGETRQSENAKQPELKLILVYYNPFGRTTTQKVTTGKPMIQRIPQRILREQASVQESGGNSVHLVQKRAPRSP